MFKRLLVPLDGSRLAESVLPATQFFAECSGAAIILFHAVEQAAPATIHGERHLLTAEEAQTYLSDVAARLARRDVTVETNVHAVKEADVARSIIEHITELNADLIVLAEHGSSGLRNMLIGNIAQQVVQRATTPLLFIRPQMENAPAFACRKILVPLDGTPIHEPALPVAIDVARACGAGLHLITVVPTPNTLSAERAGAGMLLPTTMNAVLDLAQRGAVEYLQNATARLLAEGMTATAAVVRGDTAQAILSVAEKSDTDLIVLATHGRANLDAFWSGSVTPKVLSRSEVPVLLVRVTGEETQR
ncbi:MAG: universal stress protein [Chloroflexota bacterium]|nr:universal stress protein [Chloroflexota bacterium]